MACIAAHTKQGALEEPVCGDPARSDKPGQTCRVWAKAAISSRPKISTRQLRASSWKRVGKVLLPC